MAHQPSTLGQSPQKTIAHAGVPSFPIYVQIPRMLVQPTLLQSFDWTLTSSCFDDPRRRLSLPYIQSGSLGEDRRSESGSSSTLLLLLLLSTCCSSDADMACALFVQLSGIGPVLTPNTEALHHLITVSPMAPVRFSLCAQSILPALTDRLWPANPSTFDDLLPDQGFVSRLC